MIRKLSAQRFLFLLLTAFSYCNLNAQPTTIATAYTTPVPNVVVYTVPSGGNSKPSYVTFKIKNDNTFPISLIEVASYFWHSVSAFGGNLSNDSASYSLWVSNGVSGSLPPTAYTSQWTFCGAGPEIFSSNNGVIPVIPRETTKSGRNKQLAIVCPGDTKTFCLICDDSIGVSSGGLTPNSWTTTTPPDPIAKVTLSTTGENWGTISPQNAPIVGTYLFYGSVTVDVAYPQPPALTAVPSPICVGGTVTLSATNKTCPGKDHPRFHWIGPGIPPAPNNEGPSMVVTVNSPSEFKCYMTDDTTGLGSDTATIAVTPVINTAPVVTGKFDYCFNEQYIPLTVDGITAIDPTPTLHWYYQATGGSPLFATPTVNTTIGVRQDTFYVAVIRNGCESQRAQVVFRVFPKPVPPIVSTPIFYCAGATSVPLTANGQNLRWFYAPVGGIASQLPPVPPTSVLDTFDYYVSQNNNGCESDRSHIHVVIANRPNGLIVTDVNELCAGQVDSFRYYGGAFYGAAYDWDIPDGATLLTGSERGPLGVRFDEPGIHTVRLKVGNYGCESEWYTAPITVDSLPSAVISAQKDLCRGRTELISLDYWDKSIDTFMWDFDGGQTTHYSTDQGPYGVYWETAGQKTISLKVIDAKCSAVITKSVEVHQYPDATIDIEGYNKTKLYCAGDSIRMIAHVIDPSSKYTWTPTRFFDTYSDIPAVYGRVDFDSYIKLNVVDQYGCSNTDSIQIKTEPCCNVLFPTAFSPNGDGLNDEFRMLNQGHYDVKTFHIANRWGVTVFETTNERKGWDGKFNGTPQDMGTYYYYISFMCGKNLVTQKGEFVLVR
jgi:gliding motility-associated-like protein